MSFDWQTQEEISWEDPSPLPEAPTEPASQRRWWLYIVLAVLVGAATAVLIVVRELNRRVDRAETEARQAVLSSHNVIQQAALEEDAELFVGFLSGRDADWAKSQEEAVKGGAYLDRNWLGFRRLSDVDSVAETAIVTFSPDLTAAEMTLTQTYDVDIGNRLTETVLLGQTAVYRLGPNRWLLAPPEPEFWGETRTSNGRYLTTTYPERDTEIGRRLAADLDRKLIEMCAQLADINCPPDLQVHLELTTDPSLLLLMHEGLVTTGRRLRLPTPTLIGTPQDENGYRALHRGYARWLTAVIINDLVGWVCCDHERFQQAIIHHQWQQLGLHSLPPIAYASVQDSANQLDTFVDLWNKPNDDATHLEQQMVQALIEFLTAAMDIPTSQLQHEFGEITYRNWLLNVSDIPFVDLEQAWQRFLARKVGNS